MEGQGGRGFWFERGGASGRGLGSGGLWKAIMLAVVLVRGAVTGKGMCNTEGKTSTEQ